MIVDTTLIIALALLFRILFMVNSSSSDDYTHLFFICNYKFLHYRNNNNQLHNSIIKGHKSKPYLYYKYISSFPEKEWFLISRFTNIILDTIVVVFVIFLSKYIYGELEISNSTVIYPYCYTGLILATSPILLPVNARLRAISSRVFGYFIFIFFLYFNYLILSSYLVFGTIFIMISFVLILVSSSFAFQASIWFSFILSIWYFNFYPISIICLTFFICYKFNFFGSRLIIQHKINHWNWYFRNASKGTTATGRNSLIDHLRLPFLFIKNPKNALRIIFSKSVFIILIYSALPFFILAMFLINDYNLIEIVLDNSNFKFLFGVIISAFSACLLTSLKPFLFLGQAERYFEFAMPALSILYVAIISISGKSEKWFIYIILFQIVGILANYIYTNLNVFENSIKVQTSSHFDDLINFLNNQENLKIVTIPTKMSFLISTYVKFGHLYYFRGISNPENGFLYMEDDHIESDLVRPDLVHFKSKYGINTVIVKKSTMQAAAKKSIYYNLSNYKTLYENSEYRVVTFDNYTV